LDDEFDLNAYAVDKPEAVRRAAKYKYVDPFPEEIPPALLSSNHFIRYVKATALVHPFHEDKGRIKAASYEVKAGGSAVRWDAEGRKIVTPINTTSPIYLPKNSITFVQIESEIRLPQYIALRFNLRITHVHRGLLLGTGPLIDPEFDGEILVPIHNLTDQDYSIPTSEGLIWVEFTKTSAAPDENRPYKFEPHKIRPTVADYLERANTNNPIRSSLGGALAELRTRADEAERSATAASTRANEAESSATDAKESSKRLLTIFSAAAAGAVIAIVLALHSYFGTMTQLADGVQEKASTALAKAENLAARADDDRKANEESRKALDDARREITALRDDLTAIKAARGPGIVSPGRK
jgi:deoxycytidine triphosphate deaminase